MCNWCVKKTFPNEKSGRAIFCRFSLIDGCIFKIRNYLIDYECDIIAIIFLKSLKGLTNKIKNTTAFFMNTREERGMRSRRQLPNDKNYI